MSLGKPGQRPVVIRRVRVQVRWTDDEPAVLEIEVEAHLGEHGGDRLEVVRARTPVTSTSPARDRADARPTTPPRCSRRASVCDAPRS